MKPVGPMKPMLIVRCLDGTVLEVSLRVSICGVPILPAKGDNVMVTTFGGGEIPTRVDKIGWLLEEEKILVYAWEYTP